MEYEIKSLSRVKVKRSSKVENKLLLHVWFD